MQRSKQRVSRAVIIALVVGGLISWQVGSLDAQRRQSEARAKVVSELATIRARLEGVFKASFSATEGMVHLIAYQGDMSPEMFSALSAQILAEHPTIRHISLAPANVVRDVYPREGNEMVIGFRYDSRPEQLKTVERSRELRQPLLAGPLDLVQGGRAVIIRTPMFLRKQFDAQGRGKYWGSLATVVRLSTLFEAGGLIDNPLLELSLRGKDAEGAKGAEIFGRGTVFDDDPVVMDVEVPGGVWQLAGLPRNGWPGASPLTSPYFIFGCFNSFMLAGIVGLLVRRRESMMLRNIELQREVMERRSAEAALGETQAELQRIAHYDALTGLPNRLLLTDRLSHEMDHAQRHREQVALLLLDLDGFKTVNDSMGHPAGDRLLEMVAQRLKGCVRAEDTVGRLGGDEFAVILSGLADGRDAFEVVRKILDAVALPYDIDGEGALVTGSLGIAVFPLDGRDRDELIRNADTAMYGAKEAGRNTYRFYQASMTQAAQGRLYLEQALRRAVEQDEFEVWYQPQVSLADGRCIGAEALIRWRDPQRGLVSPFEFIPLAERTGLIVPIGEIVLEQVCAAIKGWQASGIYPGPISINVAGAQITRSNYMDVLRATLDRHGLPPQCLSIEVTETLLMESMTPAVEALEAAKVLGMKSAIDDFGTGYSSLAYLKSLPIDTLKIDRAFVQDIPDDPYDMAITRAIIVMGHTLGFKVIAEGVETLQQVEFLRAEGCDEGQGYHYSRPLPIDEFSAWLVERNAA